VSNVGGSGFFSVGAEPFFLGCKTSKNSAGLRNAGGICCSAAAFFGIAAALGSSTLDERAAAIEAYHQRFVEGAQRRHGVDEETAEDSDYIYAETATVAVLKCTSLDTGSMTTPVLRAQVPTGFTANGTLTIGLYQGNAPGTLVAEIEEVDPAAGLYEHALTAGEIAAITNGSVLYFRVTAA
jgi:hypothetical protein